MPNSVIIIDNGGGEFIRLFRTPLNMGLLEEVEKTVSKISSRFTVGQLVLVLLLAMIGLAAVNVGAVYYYQDQAQDNGNAINVAGEQRMLTQEMAKHTNRIAAGNEPGEAKQSLEEAKERYETNLEALEAGGAVDGEPVPAPPEEVTGNLEDQRQEWNEFKEHVETVVGSEPGTDEFESSAEFINENDDSLMETSDRTVTAFAQIDRSQIQFMQQLLLFLFGVNFVVFVAGTLLTRRYVGGVLSEVSQALRSISRGSLDTEVSRSTRRMSDFYNQNTKNEIISLVAASEQIESYLETVTEQSQAVARTDFDDPALEEEVPGELGDAVQEMREELEGYIDEVEEAKEEAQELAEAIEERAKEYGDEMEKAAEGDLTVRLDEDTEVDGMNRIAESFNETLESNERTLSEISDFADSVAVAAEQATSGTRQMSAASSEVESSVQQIAKGAEDQSQQLQTVVDEVDSLSSTIEEVASQSADVAEKARQTAEVGEEGRGSAEDAVESMREIERLTDETVEAVEELEESFDEIGEIADIITGIADETNVLALNANIEAARAGEGGSAATDGGSGAATNGSAEGFAVVAEEVKSLAEETKTSAGEIEELIMSAQENVWNAVEDVQQTKERVEEGAETVSEAVEAFEETVETAQETDSGVQEISEATDDQAASTEEMAAMVDDVAGISEETTAEAESVADAAEEQLAAVQQVEDSMQKLSDEAEELQELVEQFETER